MNKLLIVPVMNTVTRTPLILFIGLLTLASFAAAAISNESPVQGITDGFNSSSEKTAKMAGLKPANVLADIAREMIMRSTTNSQVRIFI
jgi:archaellum component FlaG (FlaF/FlaG flagellin family)